MRARYVFVISGVMDSFLIPHLIQDDGRSQSRTPRDQSGIRDPVQRKKLKVLAKKTARKAFATHGKAGESDRKILCKKPKHLFSGKRGTGKTDRR